MVGGSPATECRGCETGHPGRADGDTSRCLEIPARKAARIPGDYSERRADHDAGIRTRKPSARAGHHHYRSFIVEGIATAGVRNLRDHTGTRSTGLRLTAAPQLAAAH